MADGGSDSVSGGVSAQPSLCLLFARGSRPSGSAIHSALTSSGLGHVSHDPSSAKAPIHQHGWLEILIDGLTFDVSGLEPGPGLSLVPPRHHLGPVDLDSTEAIGIAPGPHLSAAANALPVVRTLLRLGAHLLARSDGPMGAFWLPSGTLSHDKVFADVIASWMSGGPFPAPALTGIAALANGGIASEGLSFFIGKEMRLHPALCADRVAARRLMVRLIDRVVERWPNFPPQTLDLDDGGAVRIDPGGSAITVMPAAP